MSIKRKYVINFDNGVREFEVKTDRLETVEELENFLTEVENIKFTDADAVADWFNSKNKASKNLDIYKFMVWENSRGEEVSVAFEIGVLDSEGDFDYSSEYLQVYLNTQEYKFSEE